MSDEPNPPSLRLKPRQPPASATPVSSPVPPETPVAPVVPVVVPDVPAPIAAPAPAVPASEPVAPMGNEVDLTRLRLKPKTPVPEPSALPASTSPFSSPSAPPISAGPAPAPVAAQLSPVAPTTVSLPPPPRAITPPPVSPHKPPYVPTPRNLAAKVAPPPEKSAPPAFKADKWLAGVVLVALVGAGIVYLTKSQAKKPVANEPTVAAAPVATPAPAPSAPKLVDKPVSVVGKTIASARDVAEANDKRQEELAAVIGAGNTPAVTGTSAVPPTSPEAAVPAAPVEPPPPPPPPPATDLFKQFVVNMRVNGVFQGENARAMLNGKMVHPGDVVNSKLAITLLKIDVDAKQLVFRDDTGATVSRRY